MGGDFQVDAGDAGLAEAAQGEWNSRLVPSPALRCSGAMPRFWIEPSPPASRMPCTVPQYSGRRESTPQVRSQVVSGRKPGLRTISRIRRRQPSSSPRQGKTLASISLRKLAYLASAKASSKSGCQRLEAVARRRGTRGEVRSRPVKAISMR